MDQYQVGDHFVSGHTQKILDDSSVAQNVKNNISSLKRGLSTKRKLHSKENFIRNDNDSFIAIDDSHAPTAFSHKC